MPRINILDDSTINKIAAGEVVERPASIIKELIENSIDAGSSSISVEIEDGGKSLIKIVDNGCGIDADDINKAFLRHATSKIKKLEDLYDLNSLGFRGEALASIAAVSRLQMITKTKEALMGTEIILEGGRIISKNPVAANNGTQIYVRDLFFNTPARQKFLKSAQSEQMAITSLMNKLAIGNPRLKIKYTNNKKNVFETLGDGSLVNLIRLLYGSDISNNLINISYESKFFEIFGYIGNNNIYRSNRNLQHIFINGRYVKSSKIMEIINESYKAIIPINKYPVYFINLQIDPGSIDVNIHPSKLEVKFDKEKEISSELLDYIRGVLLRNSLVGKFKQPSSYSPSKYSQTHHDFMYTDEYEDKEINELVNESNPLSLSDTNCRTSNGTVDSISYSSEESLIPNKENSLTNNDTQATVSSGSNYLPSGDIANNPDDIINIFKGIKDISTISEIKSINEFEDSYTSNYTSVDEKNLGAKNDTELSKNTDERNDKQIKGDMQIKLISDDNENPDFVDLNYIGIVFDTYILFSKGNSMIMMDQHAAHERVRFEMYMKDFKQRDVSIQMLIEPIIIDLSVIDMEIVSKNIDKFEPFGFIVEEYGHKSISVRGVPNTFGVPESQKFIYEIIDNLDSLGNIYDTKYDEIAEIACKSSIKANDKIGYTEVLALIDKLKKCENPYTCPHGRPIMVNITKYDIEKMFKRKGI